MAIIGSVPGNRPSYKTAQLGPWQMPNGHLYTLTGGAGGILSITKSTDGGATWSTPQDFDTNTGYWNFGGQPVGDIIHVISWQQSPNCRYLTYDTTTDTWGTVLATITGTAQGSSGQAHVLIAVNANSDAAILYSSPLARVMGSDYRRASLATYIGGTFTAQVGGGPIGANDQTHYDPAGATFDSSGRFYMFDRLLANGSSFPSIRATVVLANGTINNTQTLTGQLINQGYAIGMPASTSTRVGVPWKGSGGAAAVHYTTPADAPSWSSSGIALSSISPETSAANSMVLLHDGTNWQAVWLTDAQTEIYQDTSSALTVWGTDTQILPDPTFTNQTGVLSSGAGIPTGSVSTAEQIAQEFVPSTSVSLDRVMLRMNVSGSPTDDVYVDIRQGSPTGTLLGTSNAIPLSGLTSSRLLREVVFASPIALTSGTSYVAVLRRTGALDALNTPSFGLTTVANDALNRWMYDSTSSTWSVATTTDVWVAWEYTLHDVPITVQHFTASIVSGAAGAGVAVIYDGEMGRVYYGPDIQTVIPVSLSDSGTIGVSDTANILTTESISLSDSRTIGSTEALATTATRTSADSGTITETPSYAAVRTSSHSDSGTLTSSDGYAELSVLYLSLSDGGTLVETPSYVAARMLTTSDTSTVSATESRALFIATTLSSTETLSSTDVLSGFTTTTRTDTGNLGGTEQYAVLVSAFLTLGDIGTLAETPSYAAARTQSLSDIGAVSSTDAYAESTADTLVDADTVTATEALSGTSTRTLTDAATVTRTESLTTTTTLSLTDAGSVTGAELLASSTTLSLSESSAVTSADTLATTAVATFADADTITSADAYAEVSFITVTLADSATVLSQENVGLLTIADTWMDTHTLTSGDAYTAIAITDVVETPLLSATELNTTQSALSSADSATIVAETTYEELTFAGFTAQDSVTLATTEALASVAVRDDEDAATVTASETSDAISVMALTDTSLIAIDETFFAESLIENLTLEVSDSGLLTGVDSAATATTLAPSDTALVAAESDITFFVTPDTLTDLSGLVGASETLTALSVQDVSDESLLTGVDAQVTAAFLTTTDTATLVPSEDVALAASLTMSDAVTLAASESMTAEAPRAFADDAGVMATETLAATATSAYADTDTLVDTTQFAIATARVFTDTGTITSAEDALVEALDSVLVLSDAPTLGATEHYASLDAEFVTYADSDTVSETHAFAASSLLSVTDTDTLTATETFAVTIFVALTDTGTVTSTDELTADESQAYTDTAALSVSEAFMAHAVLATSDADTLLDGTVFATFAATSVEDTVLLDADTAAETAIAVTFADDVSLGDVVTWAQIGASVLSDVLDLAVGETTQLAGTASFTDTLPLTPDESFSSASDELELFNDILHINAMQEITIVTNVVIVPAPVYADTAILRRVDSFPFLRDAVLKDILTPVQSMPFLRDAVVKDVLWKYPYTSLLLRRGTIRRTR
jgi:hypothetical protein